MIDTRKYRIRKHDFSDGAKYSIEHTCHTNDDWEAVGCMEEYLFTDQMSFKRKQFDTIEEAREWIEKDKMNIGVVVEESKIKYMDIKLTDLVLTKKHLGNLIQTNKGRTLTHREVKAFAKWGIAQCYRTVKDLPEYEDVENQVVKFSNTTCRYLSYLIGVDMDKLF